MGRTWTDKTRDAVRGALLRELRERIKDACIITSEDRGDNLVTLHLGFGQNLSLDVDNLARVALESLERDSLET